MSRSVPSLPQALPDWLSEGYFQSLFRRKSPGEEVTIQNVTLNFADEERIHGKMVRAVVDVTSTSGIGTHSYIVKCPGLGNFSSTPASTNMYRKEAVVLGEVIPAMENVLEAISPGRFGQLAPRLMDYGIDEKRFIMTQDLTVQGFNTVPRQQGMDLEHSLAYAKHLGVFHGSSAAILDKFESGITSIPLLIDSEEKKSFNGFVETSLNNVVSVLESWEDGSQYVDQVRQISFTLPQRLAEANRRREGSRLKVLCHGDMFVNNILFRHDDGGNVNGVRLVDFQLSRVGSFADDLVGFLVSAVSDDVLVDHWEEVVEAYRGSLNEVLHLLGLGGRCLSQEAVRQELREQRAVAQFAAFHMLPHTRAPGTVDLQNGGEAFSSPAYQRLLRVLIPRFHALGWLDEFEELQASPEPASSLLNKGYVQDGLPIHHLAVSITILTFLARKLLEFATLHTFFAAAVVKTISSEFEFESVRGKCLGVGVFQTTFPTNQLKMESPTHGKDIPIDENPQRKTVQEISDTSDFRTSNNGDNTNSFSYNEHGLRHTLRQMSFLKIFDIDNYPDFIRVIAPINVLSLFVLKKTLNQILNYPNTDIKSSFESFNNTCLGNSVSLPQKDTNYLYHIEKETDQEIHLSPLFIKDNFLKISKIDLNEKFMPQVISFSNYNKTLNSGIYYPNFQFKYLNPPKDYISKIENDLTAKDTQNNFDSLLRQDKQKSYHDSLISEHSGVEKFIENIHLKETYNLNILHRHNLKINFSSAMNSLHIVNCLHC